MHFRMFWMQNILWYCNREITYYYNFKIPIECNKLFHILHNEESTNALCYVLSPMVHILYSTIALVLSESQSQLNVKGPKAQPRLAPIKMSQSPGYCISSTDNSSLFLPMLFLLLLTTLNNTGTLKEQIALYSSHFGCYSSLVYFFW